MSKEIGGVREPMDPGTTVGQIDTPMCSANVGKKGDPSTHSYKGTFNTGSGGSSSIEGPGKKGAYPSKGAPKA